jgi:hypothetical protein
MLDHHVAASAIIAKPVPISPDKAALAYLKASGTRAISVVKVDGVAAFRVGTRNKPNATVVFWIATVNAKRVVKCARRLAGKNQNIDDAVVSLKKAATECRATLTPHDTAISRAADAARRLNEYVSSVRGTGMLREFKRAFKVRRETAMAAGRGFMPYKTAMSRLRLALVPLLQTGGKPAIGASLFAQVFDS